METSYTGNIDNATSIATTAATALGLTAPAQLGVMALTYAGNGFGPLNFLVRALEEEGIVNTLAEPNLTAISGEQAGFLAGVNSRFQRKLTATETSSMNFVRSGYL